MPEDPSFSFEKHRTIFRSEFADITSMSKGMTLGCNIFEIGSKRVKCLSRRVAKSISRLWEKFSRGFIRFSGERERERERENSASGWFFISKAVSWNGSRENSSLHRESLPPPFLPLPLPPSRGRLPLAASAFHLRGRKQTAGTTALLISGLSSRPLPNSADPAEYFSPNVPRPPPPHVKILPPPFNYFFNSEKLVDPSRRVWREENSPVSDECHNQISKLPRGRTSRQNVWTIANGDGYVLQKKWKSIVRIIVQTRL